MAEYAAEELGAALAVSYWSALALVSDAVELCYRLPRLWGLVQSGRPQGWKARQVAGLTGGVWDAAAAFIDRHLAHEAARNRVPTPARLRAPVQEALLRCDPGTAAAREASVGRRGVWFDHRDSAVTTRLTATLDTLDALELDATLGDIADHLRDLGDTAPPDERRARALGELARGGRPRPGRWRGRPRGRAQ